MTAGVPGSGIGGFFYLVSALLMPVQESVSICRKTSSRASRRTVVRQVINAVGVLAGVWMTGWFISQAIQKVSTSMHLKEPRIFSGVHCITLVYGLITLLAVFLFVQVLSVLLRKVPPHAKPASKA